MGRYITLVEILYVSPLHSDSVFWMNFIVFHLKVSGLNESDLKTMDKIQEYISICWLSYYFGHFYQLGMQIYSSSCEDLVFANKCLYDQQISWHSSCKNVT